MRGMIGNLKKMLSDYTSAFAFYRRAKRYSQARRERELSALKEMMYAKS